MEFVALVIAVVVFDGLVEESVEAFVAQQCLVVVAEAFAVEEHFAGVLAVAVDVAAAVGLAAVAVVVEMLA